MIEFHCGHVVQSSTSYRLSCLFLLLNGDFKQEDTKPPGILLHLPLLVEDKVAFFSLLALWEMHLCVIYDYKNKKSIP